MPPPCDRDDFARAHYCVEDFQGVIGIYDIAEFSLSEVVARLLPLVEPMVVWLDKKVVAIIRVGPDSKAVAMILDPLD